MMAAAMSLRVLDFYIEYLVTCHLPQGSVITCHFGFAVSERSWFILLDDLLDEFKNRKMLVG